MKLSTAVFRFFAAILISATLSGCAALKNEKKGTFNYPSAVFHYMAGNLKENDGLLDEAAKEYEYVLLFAPGEAGVRADLASVYHRQGLKEKAYREFRESLRLSPGNPAAHFRLGALFEDDGNFRKALEEYAKAAQLKPDYSEAYFSSGIMHSKLRMWKDAVKDYQKVIDIDPSGPYAYYNAAYCYAALNDREKAVWCYRKAAEAAPEWTSPCLSLGFLYEARGETGLAMESWEKFLALSPGEPGVSVQLGHAYLKSGCYGKAVKCLNAALNAGSGDLEKVLPTVYLLLGMSYAGVQDNTGAICAYSRVLEYDPGNKPAMFNLGAFYDKAGRFDEAERMFTLLIRADPGCADAYNYLGYLYAEKSVKLDEAIGLIKTAIKIEPGNGYFIDSLGWAYFKKGMYKDALRELKKASGFMAKDPVILDHLGDAYLSVGNPDEAVSSWERSLRLDPGNEQVKKKLEGARKSPVN